MAFSIMLRSQSRTKVSALLSNVSRFSTQASLPTALSGQKVFENKLITPLLAAKECRIAPVAINNFDIRNFSLSAPRQSAAGSDHSKLWTAERALSAALLPLLPAAIAFPSQILDSLLAISIVMHAHWGLEAIVTDYVRPILFGNTIPTLAHYLLIVYSALVLGGLLYFNFTDVGIGKAVRGFWALKSK